MALSRQQQRLFSKIMHAPFAYRITGADEADARALAVDGMIRISDERNAMPTPAARLGYYIGQDDAFAEARGHK